MSQGQAGTFCIYFFCVSGFFGLFVLTEKVLSNFWPNLEVSRQTECQISKDNEKNSVDFGAFPSEIKLLLVIFSGDEKSWPNLTNFGPEACQLSKFPAKSAAISSFLKSPGVSQT